MREAATISCVCQPVLSPEKLALLMVLEDLENDDPRSKAHLLPVMMSLILHAVLAFILWSLVFGIESVSSIRLTASLSAPSNIVSLKIQETVQPVDPLVVDGDEPARPTDATIENLLLELWHIK